MALIVEDGTGKVDAESYAAVATADTYWTAIGTPTEWSSSTTPQKEEALRVGTRYLDSVYHSEWPGLRKTEAQALDFPRDSVLRDGYTLDNDKIPVEIEYATIELAWRHRKGELLPDESDSPLTAKRLKAGPVEIEKRFASPESGSRKTFTKVDEILSRILIFRGPLFYAY